MLLRFLTLGFLGLFLKLPLNGIRISCREIHSVCTIASGCSLIVLSLLPLEFTSVGSWFLLILGVLLPRMPKVCLSAS